MMQLNGKTALVTGSSSGIGRAIALAFGQEGADVAVHYLHDQAGADEVASQLKTLGRRAPVFQADADAVFRVATTSLWLTVMLIEQAFDEWALDC